MRGKHAKHIGIVIMAFILLVSLLGFLVTAGTTPIK